MQENRGSSNAAFTSGAQAMQQGTRTRVLMILAMAVITAGVTLVSLLAIRRPLSNLVVENIASDLLHSVVIFENLQSERIAALDRENALLADLPSLKALMTTSDERTIADGAVEFWKTSGNDLFAVANRNGDIMAAYTSGSAADAGFRRDLQRFLASSRQKTWFVSGNRLFGCSVQPLYFGSRTSGTLLGWVISGFAIDHTAVEELSRATSVDAVFLRNGKLLASSLQSQYEGGITAIPSRPALDAAGTFTVEIRGERFLAVSRELSLDSGEALRLVELKSLDREARAIRQINKLVLLAGLLALLLGTVLMLVLSRVMTAPLEQLASGVRAFGSGDSAHLLPYRGTREVRELSAAFGRMRREILAANQALLESERLATIGRMASSVSHDLRHYLAAVYANSEFLASSKLPDSEKAEILAEIRTAVNGTTELLESLLMFSRTGTSALRNPHSISALVEKAVTMVRSHPDAANAEFTVVTGDPGMTEVHADARQIERAVYNLVLNACQAPRSPQTVPRVSVTVQPREQDVVIDVEDNGEGVPESIRETLFEPFVGEGKHKGSGLGLTLTQSIAADHGGGVELLCSHPGQTVFRMFVARGMGRASAASASHVRMGES